MLLHDCLFLKSVSRPAIWYMRQAGRYLPEYRRVRAQAGSFLDLCYTPSLASELTLQPIQRFDLDAAIIFSDILVIPHALGQKVWFEEGEGPKLDLLQGGKDVAKLSHTTLHQHLNSVYDAVSLTRERLAADKALFGFCGAPWTLALYMLDEKPSKDCPNTRKFAYSDPQAFQALMDMLVESCAAYLIQKVNAGADTLQIFDSWAAHVPHNLFGQVILKPLIQICERVKAQHPQVPIIIFPKGLPEYQLDVLVQHNRQYKCFEGLGISHTYNLEACAQRWGQDVCIQGNLDPALLLTTPEITVKNTKACLKMGRQAKGYIFNLGHGILPAASIENVNAMVRTVKESTCI